MFLQFNLELRFSVIKFPINAASPRRVWRIHPLFYRFLEDPSSLFRGIRLNSGQALRRGSITLQIRDLQLNDSTLNRQTESSGKAPQTYRHCLCQITVIAPGKKREVNASGIAGAPRREKNDGRLPFEV